MNDNRVELSGRVSKKERLKYTPDGTAVCEFVLAVPQSIMGRPSVGYVAVVADGRMAEALSEFLRIGCSLKIGGHLFSRSFRNAKGQRVDEIKVVLEKYEEEKRDEKRRYGG